MRKLLNILFLLLTVAATAQDRIDWDQIKAATAAGYMIRSTGINGAWTDSLRFLAGNLTITGGLKITTMTSLNGDSVVVWRGNQLYRRLTSSIIGPGLSTANVTYGTGSTGLIAEWLNDSTLTFDATGAYQLSVGTDAQRPTGAAGLTRYNSTNGNFEYYGAAAWEFPVKSSTASGLFTASSILFADANGRAAQDNTNLYWDDTNNRLGVGASPSSGTIIDAQRNVNAYQYVRAYNAGTGSSASAGIRVQNNANKTFDIQLYGSNHSVFPNQAIFAATTSMYFRTSLSSSDIHFQAGTTATSGIVIDATNNQVSIGDNAVPARQLDVTGEVRISDLTTDAPTRIVGADADGDLGAITVSTGLTLSGGNLTVTGGGFTSWTLAGDSGTQTIADGNTATFTGGWGVNTAASATDVLTLTGDSTQVATQYDILQTTQGWLDGAGAAGRIAYYSDANTLANEDALFYNAANNRLAVNDATPDYTLDLDGNTDAVALPVGTTAQRPTNQAGLIRWNSSTPGAEVANGTTWAAFTTGSTIYTGSGTLSGNTTVTAAGYYVDFNGTTTTPLRATATSTQALNIQNGDNLNATFVLSNVGTTTNAVMPVIQMQGQTSGTPAAGFGVAFDTYLETTTGSNPNAGRYQIVWTDATAGITDSKLEMSLQDAGNLVESFEATTDYFQMSKAGSYFRLGGASGAEIRSGSGTPEGAVTAPVGSLFLRTDGGALTTLYVKESGAGNTGWAAK